MLKKQNYQLIHSYAEGNLQLLSNEILFYIFTFLTPKDVRSAMLISKDIYNKLNQEPYTIKRLMNFIRSTSNKQDLKKLLQLENEFQKIISNQKRANKKLIIEVIVLGSIGVTLMGSVFGFNMGGSLLSLESQQICRDYKIGNDTSCCESNVMGYFHRSSNHTNCTTSPILEKVRQAEIYHFLGQLMYVIGFLSAPATCIWFFCCVAMSACIIALCERRLVNNVRGAALEKLPTKDRDLYDELKHKYPTLKRITDTDNIASVIEPIKNTIESKINSYSDVSLFSRKSLEKEKRTEQLIIDVQEHNSAETTYSLE